VWKSHSGGTTFEGVAKIAKSTTTNGKSKIAKYMYLNYTKIGKNTKASHT